MYDYGVQADGTHTTAFWTFLASANGVSTPTQWWVSKPGDSWSAGNMMIPRN